MEKPIYGTNNCDKINFSEFEVSIKIINDLLYNLDKNKNKQSALNRINNVKNLIEIQKNKFDKRAF